MEDGGGIDFTQFRLWYEQAGTPRVKAVIEHDAQSGRATLGLEQAVPPTPGQDTQKPLVMPLRVALYDPQGNARPNEELILLRNQKQNFHYDGFSHAPPLSSTADFSAPVLIDTNRRHNN